VAIDLYDKALLDKLNNWTRNVDNLHIFGPNETRRLFEVVADTNNDKPIELPLICVSRPLGFNVENPGKRVMSYDGLTLKANIDKSLQLNAIPINYSYQIDIYTRYAEEADEYARNFVFNFVNYNKLTISIPYNGVDYIHNAFVRLQEGVTDNSDVPERLIKGQFTRLTMGLDVFGAYLFDARYRDNYVITGDCEYSK
jgi:hypothetical protein